MGVINLGILIRKLSHVFLRKDDAATELSTLGFVKNTDYATSTIGGVVKTGGGYGAWMTGSGVIAASARTATQYPTDGASMFIAKGTLENIKPGYVAEGIVAIADGQITAPVAGTYTVKLTYDGANWGVTIIQDT